MKIGPARLVDGMTIELGRIGIWRHPSALTADVVAEVEELGYGAIWVGGSPDGDLGVVENLLATRPPTIGSRPGTPADSCSASA